LLNSFVKVMLIFPVPAESVASEDGGGESSRLGKLGVDPSLDFQLRKTPWPADRSIWMRGRIADDSVYKISLREKTHASADLPQAGSGGKGGG
jgi:hypothetical protein